MPRKARFILKGYPHHITQRGNNKELTFIENQDYDKYLHIFDHYRKKHALPTISYCPMPNHIHFATVPKTEDSLAKVFRSVNMNYAQYFNKKYDRVGHVWQCRFFSCAMEESHLYSAIKYIENNPVRANLVSSAEASTI